MDIDPLILIPSFIHDFLCIHPFQDGNGRLSRLLTTLLLMKSNFVVAQYISIENKINETKEDYYDCLSASSERWNENNNNVMHFIKYFLSVLLAAYRDFEDRIRVVNNKSSAKDIVKSVIESILGRFEKKDLLIKCPNLSKSSIEQSLQSLCSENFIEKFGVGRSTYYCKK